MKTRKSEGGHLRDFVVQALANYRETGAIAPSSRNLARLIAECSEVRGASEIVEIGAGTGVFTREIRARMPRGARLTIVEKNRRFAELLRVKFPDSRVIEGCATKLREHLGAGTKASRVVSGLPWAAMPDRLQDALLEEIRESLEENGLFTTFAYFGPHMLPAGRRFRDRLMANFPSVEKTGIVYRNLPPAFVYRARKSCSR